jgi:hypothetical protein
MTEQTRKHWEVKNLKHCFRNAEKINYNYAQADQDIFVLSMLDGKENGTYLEIGAAWPGHISNTALLELNFGWTGISLDYVDDYPQMWKDFGRKAFVQGNGQTVNFDELLSGMPKVVDYLSLDCDPGVITFEILQRLPLDTYKFRIITFEHEDYCEGPAIKLASRKFLTDHGYQLIVNNISDHGIARDYEDWWVHPDYVDHNKIQLYTCVDDSIKDYKIYLYK